MNALVWLCAGALGLWLGMPNPLVQLPLLALLYPAALCALGRSAASWKAALRLGWLCGLVGASACMYWVAIPVHAFGGLPWPLAIPCALAIGAYIGLYGGLFAVLTQVLCGSARVLTSPSAHAAVVGGQGGSARALSSPWRSALILGLGWYLLEWFRGWFLTGFPWLSLASAFAPWPVLVQGVSVLGTYGLSGVFVGLVCLLCEGFVSRRHAVPQTACDSDACPRFWRRSSPLWAGMLGFAVLFTFGWGRMTFVHPVAVPSPPAATATGVPVAPGAPGVPVALVQGNLDQNVKWEPSMQRLTVQRYLTLSAEALAFPSPAVGLPQVLIWPETAMPFNYQGNPVFPPRVRAFAKDRNVAVLFGAPGFRRQLGGIGSTSADTTETFNRAYLVTAGVDSGWYEKEHLVPFGEYMPPFLDLPFLRAIQGVGNFTAGEKIVPLPVVLPRSADDLSASAPTSHAVDSGNVPEKPLVLGVLICYETIFPELARQRVADGAEVFVNISNDAWFGLSSAPEQHLQLTLLRAVEQGRWLMRATNTGISAFIDPSGRIRARTELFKAQTLSARVPPLHTVTAFFYLGPYLPALAAALMLWLCRERFTRKRDDLQTSNIQV